MFRTVTLLGWSCLLVIAALTAPVAAAGNGTVGPGVPPFTVRPGYRVTLVAKGIANCRFLQFDGHGRLFVSEPGPGKILILSGENSQGQYTVTHTFLTGYRLVQAMVYRHGWLWFATSAGVYKTRDNGTQNKAGKITTLLSGLPHGGAHLVPQPAGDRQAFLHQRGRSEQY